MLLRVLVLMILLIQTSFVFGNAGLDVVFVIDESGSMWGSKRHPKANDKYRHRISIVENVILRLAEQVKGTSRVHHISVIEFGGDTPTSVAVPISNMVLKYDPAHPDAVVDNALYEVLTTLYTRKHNMGNTNTSLAMRTALTEFQKLKTASGGVTREQKLLIITDGRPYTYRKQLSHLQRDIKNQASTLKYGKVGLWVVGLNDASNYWNSGDGEFWEEVVGFKNAHLAQTSFPSIAMIVQHIIDQWLDVESVSLLQETYHSRPYLTRIVFNAHFSKPGAQLEIIDPNGYPVSRTTGTTQQRTYARYVIEKEDVIVGTYQINKRSSSGYKIFVEQHPPTLLYIGPQGTINQNVKNRIVFKIMQGTQGLTEFPYWPVTAKIRVIPPVGHPQILPAIFEGKGKYSASWTPTQLGIHQFDFQVKVEVQTDKGPRHYDLVDDKITAQVEVLAYTPSHSASSAIPDNAIWLHLEQPDPEKGLGRYPWDKTVIIDFSVYKGEHQITTLQKLVKQPETWLTLEVMDKSGIPLSAPISLKVKENIFSAQISIEELQQQRDVLIYQLNLRVTSTSQQLLTHQKLYGIWLP